MHRSLISFSWFRVYHNESSYIWMVDIVHISCPLGVILQNIMPCRTRPDHGASNSAYLEFFWAACMKNQSEIQVSCAQVFATYMRQIFDKTYKIVKIYLINFFMAKTNMFWIFFHQKWPNLGPMAKLTYNHIFRGEKVRRGMFMP